VSKSTLIARTIQYAVHQRLLAKGAIRDPDGYSVILDREIRNRFQTRLHQIIERDHLDWCNYPDLDQKHAKYLYETYILHSDNEPPRAPRKMSPFTSILDALPAEGENVPPKDVRDSWITDGKNAYARNQQRRRLLRKAGHNFWGCGVCEICRNLGHDANEDFEDITDPNQLGFAIVGEEDDGFI
jgi:hypothetical protein